MPGTSDLNIFSAAGAKLAMFGDRLQRWRRDEPVLPVTLEIHPTERCNHHCPGCQAKYVLPVQDVHDRAARGVDLDLAHLDSVFDEPPEGVVLSGNTGDPLLHPNIDQLLLRLAARHVPTVLITNGEAITAALAEIVVSSCHGVRISLDADGPAMFARTHGRPAAAWCRVQEAIRILVAARAKLGIANHCLMGAGFLTAASTRHGMFGAARLARELGLDYIQFRPFHFTFDDISVEIQRCRDELEISTFRVWSSQQKYERFVDVSRSYRTCHGAHFYTVVDARGDLYICCHHVGNPAARYGSLRTSSWSQLVRSSQRSRCRDRFDVASCVPLCRLHAHNESLERWKQSGQSIDSPRDAQVRAHASFL